MTTMVREKIDYKEVHTENLEQVSKSRSSELSIAKQLYQIIQDEVPVGIWKQDFDGCLEYCNPLFKDVYGEMDNIMDIFDNDDDRNVFKKHMMNEDRFEMIFKIIVKNELEWFRIKFFKIDEGFIGMTDNKTTEFTTINKLLNLKKEIKDVFKDAKR